MSHGTVLYLKAAQAENDLERQVPASRVFRGNSITRDAIPST